MEAAPESEPKSRVLRCFGDDCLMLAQSLQYEASDIGNCGSHILIVEFRGDFMKYRGIFSLCSLLLLLLIFSELAHADQTVEIRFGEVELSEHMDLPTLIKLSYERNSKIKAARTECQALHIVCDGARSC